MQKLPLPPILQNKSLKNFSTFGIGGEARYFSEAKTAEEVSALLIYCHQNQIPFFILGKGSNSIFDDRGFNGLVIHNKITFFKQNGPQFKVGAGYSFSRLGQLTAKLGFSGLEFAAAIPATVGGAIFMNAGANGQECFDCLQEVDFITKEGQEIIYQKQELSWGYRTSLFQKERGAIVGATFLLSPSETAKARQREIIEYRLKTQPYGDKSCGCIFQNPPGYAAGKLIEDTGLKGLSIQGAVVSSHHANFIVNKGEATTTQNVLELIENVKQKVYLRTGIMLKEEIRIIPYDTAE